MVLVSILMLMMKVSTASADTNVNVSSTDDFDWTPVMEAIIQVESEGNPKQRVEAMAVTKVTTRLITPIASVFLITRINVISENSILNLSNPTNAEWNIPSLGL